MWQAWIQRCSAISAPCGHLVVQNNKRYFSPCWWGAEQGSWTVPQPIPRHAQDQSRVKGSSWCVTAADTNSPCPAKALAAATQVCDRKMDGEAVGIGRIFWNAPKCSASKEDKELVLLLLNVCVVISRGKYWEIHGGRTQGQLLNPWLLPLSCRERREAQKGRGGFLCRWQSLRNNHSLCTLE